VAQITWTGQAIAQFSPEELECASRGGMWDRQTQTCTFAQPLGASTGIPIVRAPVVNTGTVDPDQMFADGFVYWNGEWVRWDDPRVLAATSSSTPRPPGMSSVLPQQVIQGASVLGTTVPVAPAVLLPSFVGGRLGTVEMGAGMRPESGGRERVEFGTMPKVRF